MKPLLGAIVTGILIVGLAALPVTTPITAQQQTQTPCPTVTFTVEGVEQPDGTWPCWDVTICADEKAALEIKINATKSRHNTLKNQAESNFQSRSRNCRRIGTGGIIGGLVIAIGGAVFSSGGSVIAGIAMMGAAAATAASCLILAMEERQATLQAIAEIANTNILEEIQLGTNDPGERYIAHAY